MHHHASMDPDLCCDGNISPSSDSSFFFGQETLWAMVRSISQNRGDRRGGHERSSTGAGWGGIHRWRLEFWPSHFKCWKGDGPCWSYWWCYFSKWSYKGDSKHSHSSKPATSLYIKQIIITISYDVYYDGIHVQYLRWSNTHLHRSTIP